MKMSTVNFNHSNPNAISLNRKTEKLDNSINTKQNMPVSFGNTITLIAQKVNKSGQKIDVELAKKISFDAIVTSVQNGFRILFENCKSGRIDEYKGVVPEGYSSDEFIQLVKNVISYVRKTGTPVDITDPRVCKLSAVIDPANPESFRKFENLLKEDLTHNISGLNTSAKSVKPTGLRSSEYYGDGILHTPTEMMPSSYFGEGNLPPTKWTPADNYGLGKLPNGKPKDPTMMSSSSKVNVGFAPSQTKVQTGFGPSWNGPSSDWKS